MLAKYKFIIKTTKRMLISLSLLFLFLILFKNKSDNISFIQESNSKTPKLSDSEVNVGYPVFSSNGENSYRIFAEKISKGAGEKYFMDKISGIYNLEDKENITVNAVNCTLNNENDSAILKDDVKIGYENYLLLTEKIDIDLDKKSAENNSLVTIIGDDGRIVADRFNTNEDFCEVIFNGNVRAHFNLGSTK